MDTVERYYYSLPPSTSSNSLPSTLLLQTLSITPSSPSNPTSPSTRKLWGEVPRGLYLIRGENVAYLGEIDLDTEDEVLEGWEKVEAGKIHELDKRVRAEKKGELERRNGRMRRRGLMGEKEEEVVFL